MIETHQPNSPFRVGPWLPRRTYVMSSRLDATMLGKYRVQPFGGSYRPGLVCGSICASIRLLSGPRWASEVVGSQQGSWPGDQIHSTDRRLRTRVARVAPIDPGQIRSTPHGPVSQPARYAEAPGRLGIRLAGNGRRSRLLQRSLAVHRSSPANKKRCGDGGGHARRS